MGVTRAGTVGEALRVRPVRYLLSRWPLRALAYVASGVPVGLFTLVWLPVSMVLGAVALTPLAVWPLAALERRRLALLGGPPVPDPHAAPAGAGLFPWLRTRYAEAATWQELAYAVLHATVLLAVDLAATLLAVVVPVILIVFALDGVRRGLPGALDLDHVGMFGHSDGGSTTAHAMHVDPRITAGVDVDGTLWTPQAVAGSDRPLLLFGRQNLDPFEASTWAEFRTSQRGPKLQLGLTGSTHSTFDDAAVLAPQVAAFLGISPEQLAAAYGTINGQRAVAVVRAYLNAYFGRYLRHHDSRLLSGPSARFPEVQFVS